MAQETTLLSNAQRVTKVESGDSYAWRNDHTLMLYSLSSQAIFDVDTRTHVRIRKMGWQGAGGGAFLVRPAPPRWLPSGAIIIGYDETNVEQHRVFSAMWIVHDSPAEKATSRLPAAGVPNSVRYGVWVTEDKGKAPRLLGVAPLSPQEFESLRKHSLDFWKYPLDCWSTRWVPGEQQVSFVYRGGIYIISVRR